MSVAAKGSEIRTYIPKPVAATLIVAASDSLHPERADFVCPIADALGYITTTVLPTLPAGGGAIMLLEGTYNVSTNGKPLNIATTNNITIRGQGKGTHLKLSNGIQSNIIQVTGSTGIIIADLYCDGTTSAADAGSDSNQCGIYFNNVDESKIRNVWSENNKRFGIHLYNGSTLNEVIGCFCQGNGDIGIILYSSSNNNTVTGNTCQGNMEDGIYLQISSINNTVTGNTCNDNSRDGIILYSSSNNNTVTGNTCNDNVQHGIYLNASLDNTVTGNTCRGNGLIGIHANSSSNNNTVTGNTCQGNTEDGIYLHSSSNNTVTGNTCQGNGYTGIVLYSSSNNNTVTGNTSQGNLKSGIILHTISNNNTITGNTCNDNVQHGIYLNASLDNTVTGNTCVDNDSDDTNSFDGIYIDVNSDYNLIEANKCYVTTPGAKQRYGIRINSADCNGNIVWDNDLLQGGRTANFSDAGTGTIYFSPEQNIAMDLLAEDTNYVVAAHDLTAGPGPCAIAAQIDKPRNITITITDVGAGISAFQIDVVGINTKGEADTEQFVFAGGLVQTGDVAWAHITSITITSITGAGAGDVLDVGIGSKLGITGHLYITADVFHVSKDNGDWSAASYTVNTTYDTVDVSTGGAIGAGSDFTIFFKASRNRIK